MTWLADLCAAFWEMIQPRFPEVPDEDRQSIADQVAARSAWVQSRRHPRVCDGGCRCITPDGAA